MDVDTHEATNCNHITVWNGSCDVILGYHMTSNRIFFRFCVDHVIIHVNDISDYEPWVASLMMVFHAPAKHPNETIPVETKPVDHIIHLKLRVNVISGSKIFQ
jgi:hypothetical protein